MNCSAAAADYETLGARCRFAGEVPTPAAGDTIEVDGAAYFVLAEPAADRERAGLDPGREAAVRLTAALEGDLEAMLTAERHAAERAVTAAIRQATDGLKTELRRQVAAAGLGLVSPLPGAAKSIRRAARASVLPAMSGRRRRTSFASMPRVR